MSIRDFPTFITDILRLSDVNVSNDTKQQIRKSIYDTIDARVANATSQKYKELRKEYAELNHLNYVLQSELLDSDTSLKAVEKSLDGLGYFGTYAEQINQLKIALEVNRLNAHNFEISCNANMLTATCFKVERDALNLRVAELEAATEHLGLTPQQAKDGLSRHKALVAERDRLQSECDRLRDAAKQALLALHYHTEQTRPIDTSFGAMNALDAALMPEQKEQAK